MPLLTAKGYPYPDPLDNNNTPADIEALARKNDERPGIGAYTQAQIDAFVDADRWVGRIVWNVTAGTHQKWDGATWSAVASNPDLSAYARKDQAQTFVGNQEIEGALDVNDGATAGGSLTGWTDANGIPKLIQNGAFRVSHGTQPYLELYKVGVSLVQLYTHNGTPEGVITAAPGCLCLTATGFLYIKRSGTGNTGWKPVAYDGMDRLAESTAGSGTVSFTGIPGTYKHLLLVGELSNNGSVEGALTLRFNGDTGAAYDHQRLHVAGTSVSTASATGQSGMHLGELPTGQRAAHRILVPNYTSALAKRVAAESARGGKVMQAGGAWSGVAAITSIDLSSSQGTVVNGYLTLYGLR